MIQFVVFAVLLAIVIGCVHMFRGVAHVDRGEEWLRLADALGLEHEHTDNGASLRGHLDDIETDVEGFGQAGDSAGGFGQLGGATISLRVGNTGLQPREFDLVALLEPLEVIFDSVRFDDAPMVNGRELTGSPNRAVGDLTDDGARSRLFDESSTGVTVEDGWLVMDLDSDGFPRASEVRGALTSTRRLAAWLSLSQPSLAERVLDIVGRAEVDKGRRLLAIDFLGRSFQHTDAIRTTATATLEQSDDPKLVVALSPLVPREHVIERLVGLINERYRRGGPRAAVITALAPYLADPDLDVMNDIVACLAPAEPMVVRRAAADALLYMDDDRTAAVAAKALSEAGGDEELVESLVDVVTGSGGTGQQQPLIALLSDKSPRVQWLAIDALAQVGGVEAISALLEFEGSASVELASSAMEAVAILQTRLGLASRPGGLSVAEAVEGQLSYTD